jgi:hypothetical protein
MNKTDNTLSINTEDIWNLNTGSDPASLARDSLDNPNHVYEIFLDYYNRLPANIIEHRQYFSSEGRGFGEDAFHGMWYYLFKEILKKRKEPLKILEIGVFRGQTLSLFTLLSKHFNIDSEVWGISPLAAVNDSVSVFPTDVDYEKDIVENFNRFNLGYPNLYKSSSVDRGARFLIKDSYWDLIYIDGNHDLPFVISDYMNCVDQLKHGGLLVVDDSSLYTSFERLGSFKGHVGPSQVVEYFAFKELRHILRVGHNNVFMCPYYSRKKDNG